MALSKGLNSVLVFGGYDSASEVFSGELWRQNLTTGEWTLEDGSLDGRVASSLVAGRNGKVFVLGGTNATGQGSRDSTLGIDIGVYEGDGWRS